MRRLLLLAVVAVIATGCKRQEHASDRPVAPVVAPPPTAPGTAGGPETSGTAPDEAPPPSAKHVEREGDDDRDRDDAPARAKRAPSRDDVAGAPPPAIEDELPPSLYAPPREPPPPPPPIPEEAPPMPRHDPEDRGLPPRPTRPGPPADVPAPPTTRPDVARPDHPRSTRLAAVSQLCVTTGAAAIGKPVDKAAMRAVSRLTDGEAAEMTFTFRGETAEHKKLASGQLRKQLGLKLRAENGCNLIYVMWRLDPKPRIQVQVKRNPGAKDHKACGAGGYTNVKAAESKALPAFRVGTTYALRAEIRGDELVAYVDDQLVWRGTLPASARELRGPAGIRSDNLAFDLVAFSAPSAGASAGNAKCLPEDRD